MPDETEVPPAPARWNETRTDYPRGRTIHSLFEEVAARSPGSVAIEFGALGLTYGDLNARANRLARRLVRLGIGRGTLVGLCLERSAELIVGMLAILKAGGAYVPLDPDYPDPRLSFMIRDAATPVILAGRTTTSRLAPSLGRAAVLLLDPDGPSTGAEDAHDLEVGATAEDLAYVMYTSGSTGTPKGVMIGHRSVVRLVRDTNYCRFGDDQVFLQLAPISFDASTFEIWGALLNGGRLALMPPRTPGLDEIGSAIRRHGVTTLWLTSGLFHLMVDRHLEDLRPLKQLLAGGDVLSARHVQRALDALHDGAIINGYGPTEGTTFACCRRMTKGYRTGRTIPIGRPIANTTAHILDEGLRPVPAGSPGELCIGGDGLAIGYLNQPELTALKFVPDPSSDEPGARLYRTGDLARLREDGDIEFLGRIDEQVKILGHRIEPGEVEAAIRQHPAVGQTVVVAADGPRGEKRLVAYVVARNSSTLAPSGLRGDLADHLPSHMIPSTFLVVDSLPLTPNGKVDRSALPSPNQAVAPGPDSPPPVADLEREIAAAWRRVLGRDVGPTDNFFDLGGDSLQLIEVHSDIRKSLDREVSLMDLFEYTTVRSLADHLDREPVEDPALARARERAMRQKEAFARHEPPKAGR